MNKEPMEEKKCNHKIEVDGIIVDNASCFYCNPDIKGGAGESGKEPMEWEKVLYNLSLGFAGGKTRKAIFNLQELKQFISLRIKQAEERGYKNGLADGRKPYQPNCEV